MKKYFFDIFCDSKGFIRDEVGEPLEDDSSAWREALAQLRSVEDMLVPGDTCLMLVRADDRPIFALEVSSRCIDAPAVVPGIAGPDKVVSPTDRELLPLNC